MASMEQLQAMCTEFSNNFASVTSRYDNAMKELEIERTLRAKSITASETSERENKRLLDIIKSLKQDADELLPYKERYYAICVAVEHLKGRLEASKKAASDREEEYQIYISQLKQQVEDLRRQSDVGNAQAQIKALKGQTIELEERCALYSGSSLEERERLMQHQLTSNTTVRELQLKVTSLENRARAQDIEVQQLRAMLRRSSEIQSEATEVNDRIVLEKRALQGDLEQKCMMLTASENRILKQQRTFEEKQTELERQVVAAEANASEEISKLKILLKNKTIEVDDALEKISVLTRSVQSRVANVKDEMDSEIDELRRAKVELTAEINTLQWKLKSQIQATEEARQNIIHSDGKAQELERQRCEISTRCEMLSQKLAYATAETVRNNNVIQRLKEQLSEAQERISNIERSSLDGERYRLRNEYLEREAEDSKAMANDTLRRLGDIERDCERKLKVMFKQLKAEQKRSEKFVNNNNNNNNNKGRVVTGGLCGRRSLSPSSLLLSSHHISTLPHTNYIQQQFSSFPQFSTALGFDDIGVNTCAAPFTYNSGDGGENNNNNNNNNNLNINNNGCDVLQMLKSQGEHACRLNESLKALSTNVV